MLQKAFHHLVSINGNLEHYKSLLGLSFFQLTGGQSFNIYVQNIFTLAYLNSLILVQEHQVVQISW